MTKIVKLSEVCTTITKGTTPTTLGMNFSETGIPFVRVNNFKEGVLTLSRDILYISEETHKSLARSIIKSGDVLLSIAGTIGRSCVVPQGSPEANCNQAVCVVRPNGKSLHNQYLQIWLTSNDAMSQVSNGKVTGVISNLSLTNVRNLKIPLPPLEEQKRIAGILDAADRLRAQRRETLAQLDTLLQSTFLELFGDPVTNPKGWEQATLGSLIEPDDKINYGVVQPGDDTPTGKPLIRVGDFVKGTLKLSGLKLIDPEIEKKYRRSRLNGSELLVSCVGSVGTVCKVPFEAAGFNIARAVSRIPLRKEISRDFMLHCLRSDAVQRHFLKETRTVSQPTLNISLIKTAPVIQPPLDLQRRFAAIVESVEKQKARQRAHLAELDTLFASLQSRAFNGEL